MRINVNLKPARSPRAADGELLFLSVGVLGVTLAVVGLLISRATPSAPQASVCERMIALAQTRSDSLVVFAVTPASDRETCFEQLTAYQ